MKKAVLIAACLACVDWTRFSGIVKSVNLKDQSVTIQDRDGNLLTVPIDYQVKVIDKHGEMVMMKSLTLDSKITLLRTPQEKPLVNDTDMPPPESPEQSQRGPE